MSIANFLPGIRSQSRQERKFEAARKVEVGSGNIIINYAKRSTIDCKIRFWARQAQDVQDAGTPGYAYSIPQLEGPSAPGETEVFMEVRMRI